MALDPVGAGVEGDFLNPLSAELRSSFVEKQAGTIEKVRTMANAWLKEKETPDTARRALNC
jgi:hypothetical protein